MAYVLMIFSLLHDVRVAYAKMRRDSSERSIAKAQRNIERLEPILMKLRRESINIDLAICRAKERTQKTKIKNVLV